MFEAEVTKTVEILRKGGTILYPTDTIWGLGCDATSEPAVEKVYRIKQRMESKSLIILVDHEERLRKYVGAVPDIALDLMKGVDTPLTIIYPEARNLAPNVIAEDGSVAVRIVKNDFCKEVISRLNRPIVSTSANISGQPAPLIFKCIPVEVQEQVDYVVNLYQDVLREVKPSTIVKLTSSGEFEIIRK